jgi:hypothetical protein
MIELTARFFFILAQAGRSQSPKQSHASSQKRKCIYFACLFCAELLLTPFLFFTILTIKMFQQALND